MDNNLLALAALGGAYWWMTRKQSARGVMVPKRTESNGYVITTNRDGGYWTSFLIRNDGKKYETRPTNNQTEALQNLDDLSLLATDFEPAKLGSNPVDKDEVAYLRQQVTKTEELVERARRAIAQARNNMDARDSKLFRRPVVSEASPELLNAIGNLKNFERSKRHWQQELSVALQRNPGLRAKNLDKAEEKVRKLADAARGSMASPQSKAAYRRALDELMQLRIDAGTQGTLFDVAPRQTTQRGLPGLFDNPPSWEDYARWRELAAKVEAAIKDDMAELPDPGTYKRKPTALEQMSAGGKKMSDVPKWTVAQVEAKRKSMIAAGMKRFKITGEEDTWRVREHLDTAFRPKYPRY